MNTVHMWISSGNKNIGKRFWPVIFIILIALAITIPNNPSNLKIPNRDSGVFLYMGSSILDGQVPYRDAWDHKPPVIFYLNAFGLIIGGGSIWGVWAIEVFSLILTAWIGFRLLDESIDRFAAVFGTLLWLGTYILLWIRSGGNSAEEYAFLFQF